MNLKIENLSKTYPNGKKALDCINLEVTTGMFGILGPNGAGKSTLMRTIATLQLPSSGNIHFNTIDILHQQIELKKVLGYLPQDFDFPKKEKPYNLLLHFGLLKGIQSKKDREILAESLLKKVNLWDARKQKLGTFSGGMKQRMGIALVLLGDPKLIIVDEPTAGLDPDERNRFHNLLSELGENVVVILSTHIVEDVSDLCTNMAIIKDGKIITKGSPANVINDVKGKIWTLEIPKSSLVGYQEKYNVVSTRLYAGKTIIHVYSETRPGEGFEPTTPTLQHAYFRHLRLN